MLKEKNINKILSSCVVFIMLLSAFFVIAPVNIVASETNDSEPSIRIYGEDNAVYPTQSYYDSNDFIYPEEFDPFDPGIIEKDSITFNSAFWFGHDEYEIKARGDASEKIFLRAFYEPGYYHGVDSKMDDCSDVNLLPVEQFDAIVTETTYFLTTLYDRDPTYGYPGETKIALPYVSSNPDIPGMEEAGLLDMVWADDDTSGPITGYTDGAIAVEKVYTFDNVDYTQDIIINFMDHKVVIDNFEDNDPFNDKLDFTIYYVGNMYDQASAPAQHTILESFWGFNYFFDRDNHIQSDTDACHRWYIRIENADADYLRITVGRVLEAGETFYVDGVRYDMPAVYVDYDIDRDLPVFKYITFQSPIPKGSPMWDNVLSYNVDDFSHVTSQYLASLDPYDIAWLLPPFNENHMMIDDIGFDSYCLPEAGILLDAIKEPLEFYYIAEDVEGRFDSSLAERVETIGVNEYWYWYNVYTQPNHYTEFILPDQETTSDYYDADDLNWQRASYYTADGNEYLITTSFIAPNSIVNIDRSNECKTYDEHEIFDRVVTIALYGE
ncbi:MAG: hypothetical protein MUO82_05930, partial [Candidatus Thermoplasmatota archaeon]|nr:hypothetical protein [Candidatus Thermoplasmatota archaeon]